MKKNELAQRLADQEAVTPAAAADRLDEIIFGVLKKLKQGKAAAFPGLGRIRQAEPAQAANLIKATSTKVGASKAGATKGSAAK